MAQASPGWPGARVYGLGQPGAGETWSFCSTWACWYPSGPGHCRTLEQDPGWAVVWVPVGNAPSFRSKVDWVGGSAAWRRSSSEWWSDQVDWQKALWCNQSQDDAPQHTKALLHCSSSSCWSRGAEAPFWGWRSLPLLAWRAGRWPSTRYRPCAVSWGVPAGTLDNQARRSRVVLLAGWTATWLCQGRTSGGAPRHPTTAGWGSQALSAAAPLFQLKSRQVSLMLSRMWPTELSNRSALNRVPFG